MWDRKFEVARFNGHTLNVLSVSFDGGQRLQVSEIPYQDQPHIRAMGASAVTVALEVIFVGSASIDDSNALIAALGKVSAGALEHPWLGEIELCFKTYSQKISTKRGLVTLALSFVRTNAGQNLRTHLTSSKTRTSYAQIKTVERISSEQFVVNVESMSLDDINDTKERFNALLGELISISSRLNIYRDGFIAINAAIHTALNSINALSISPFTLTKAISAALYLVGNAVKSEPSQSDIADNSRAAQMALLTFIDPVAPSYLNTQIIVGAIQMNKDLVMLELSDHFDVLASNKSPALIISDLELLIDGVNNLILDATQVATVESVKMYEALVDLFDVLQEQNAKAKTAITPKQITAVPRYTTALTLAHNTGTSEPMLRKLNPLLHPLFVSGSIALGSNA